MFQFIGIVTFFLYCLATAFSTTTLSQNRTYLYDSVNISTTYTITNDLIGEINNDDFKDFHFSYYQIQIYYIRNEFKPVEVTVSFNSPSVRYSCLTILELDIPPPVVV